MDNVLLDVAIGLAMLFVIVSIVASALLEAVGSLAHSRGRMLRDALKELLSEDIARAVLAHPAIALRRPRLPGPVGGESAWWKFLHRAQAAILPLLSFSAEAGQVPTAPSSLGGPALRRALVDVLHRARLDDEAAAVTGGPIDADVLRRLLGRLPELPRRDLESRLGHTAGDASAILETWFEEALAPLSETFKQRSRLWSGLIGFVFALAIGGDAIGVAWRLEADPVLRAQVVAQAMAVEGSPEWKSAEALRLARDNAVVPFRPTLADWPPDASPAERVVHGLTVLLGCAITGFAAALGAPFWFDLIGRLVPLRNDGRSPR